MRRDPKIIWDMPTRITHWALAVCVVLNLFVLEEGGDWHEWLGYAAVTIIFIRAVFGLVRKNDSSLRYFPLSLLKMYNYAKSGLDSRKFLQHNPLAAITYVAIWSLIVALAVSGYMMDLDEYWGEEWLQERHALFSDLLMVMIGIHLLGVLIDAIRYRRKSWMPIIDGGRRDR